MSDDTTIRVDELAPDGLPLISLGQDNVRAFADRMGLTEEEFFAAMIEAFRYVELRYFRDSPEPE